MAGSRRLGLPQLRTLHAGLEREALRALLEPLPVRREIAQLAALVDQRIAHRRAQDHATLERRIAIAAERRPSAIR